MSSTIQPVLSIIYSLQAAFSAYSLYLASISIQNLQKYEEKSEKAAEWSNTAEKQLHKSRTTQASGTLAMVASFITSSASIFYPSSKFAGLAIACANVGALLAARVHVGNFWNGKAKVPLPGAGEYNDAISRTQALRLNMAYLASSWGLCVVLLAVL
ncbi:hypothetical protein GLAREA_04685 [Glarea lozoyensis ATCC 20868]|uniref:DUF1772-domain-containing protein n=1 Tax=Glarea lozoyensis (strain ATCC 20868 / MF5171) TaxID=1116229 RepID=S3CS53_GLAL2|nr:uncharacterized protein GLAREA_04685 [Glarea lozoyensis ATCC 20868]EPE27894.1 hypothetical protein GLAREA_04685 [Glarea lozoyensis ATCC 20868]